MVEDVKKELETLKKNQNEIKKMDEVLKHLQTLQDSCITLGKALMEIDGDLEFGRMLIANSFVHDQSKFYGIEWEYLNPDGFENHKEKFLLALDQHQKVNPHHPEHWEGFKNMPRIRKAELVCDLHARSILMGTDLRKYFKDEWCKRYGLGTGTKDYKELVYFIDLLIGKPFKKVKKDGSKDSKGK